MTPTREQAEQLARAIYHCPQRFEECSYCADSIDDIHAALSAAYRAGQVAPAWQPIETAPKIHDGLLLSDGVCVSQGGWLSEVDQGAEYEGQCGAPCAGWWSVDGIENPTHWMPLPAAP